ncbi:MAG: holo-ACP synthase [Endomicrobium sp.]|jgi:holo-[acyl-carrier protein] synthase|nr:holo-ACP synthase [Endomicrobium sp.]
MNIGADIEEIKRFQKYVKDKERLEKLFSEDEISFCLSKKNPAQHLAARFAAKEAIWKSIGDKHKKLIITDISIKNAQSGKPEVYIKNKRYKKIDVSLSHADKYVVAVAIAF